MIKRLLYVLIFLCITNTVFATDVFYSVSPFGTGTLLTDGGTNPTIVVDGSGNATVTMNDATWTHGDNIGVGVCVEYNSIVSYIDTITSATSFHLVTALGANAASQTSTDITSVHYEWADIQTAENEFTDGSHINTTNLASSNYIVHIACYYDPDNNTLDTSMAVTGFTTSDTYYLRFFTPTGLNNSESINTQRHNGISESESGGRVDSYAIESASNCIHFSSSNPYDVRLEGLQLHCTQITSSRYGILFAQGSGGSNDCEVTDCIIRMATTSTNVLRRGIQFSSSGSTGAPVITNTIIYGAGSNGGGATSQWGFYQNDSSFTVTLINCTIYDWYDGIREGSGTISATNTVSAENSNTDFVSVTTTTNCAADDVGEAEQLDETRSVDFTDATNGDFSLVSGSDCVDNGTDTDAPLADIIGTARSSTDIGAWEYDAPPSGKRRTMLISQYADDLIKYYSYN